MHNYIGVLGGMGYRATLIAYERLNLFYQKEKGNTHSCPIKLLSIDFHEINALLPYQIDDAAALLEKYIPAINQLDVKSLIMINNTMHEVMDKVLEKHALLPDFGHIGKLLNKKVSQLNVKNCMIIGSKYTMTGSYLQSFLPKGVKDIQVKSTIQDSLEQLRKTYFTTENKDLSIAIFNEIQASHPEVDLFIIACTEHSIAFEDLISSPKWIDTIDLQCAFALNPIL